MESINKSVVGTYLSGDEVGAYLMHKNLKNEPYKGLVKFRKMMQKHTTTPKKGRLMMHKSIS